MNILQKIFSRPKPAEICIGDVWKHYHDPNPFEAQQITYVEILGHKDGWVQYNYRMGKLKIGSPEVMKESTFRVLFELHRHIVPNT